MNFKDIGLIYNLKLDWRFLIISSCEQLISQNHYLKIASLLSGPWFEITLTLIPSGIILPSSWSWWYSTFVYLVNPNFLEIAIFYLPGNLNIDLLRASLACFMLCGAHLIEIRISPISTLAALPNGFPKAPLIPCWSLSAPAHESILLILRTWNGWALTLMWKASLPAWVSKYLLQAIRAASIASDVICSFSPETKWTQLGKTSALAYLLPISKILIFESGTPLQYLDFGYGFPF